MTGSASKEIEVKTETKSDEEILQEKAKDLGANPRPMLRRFQDYELECKVLAEKASATKYTGELATDANKFLAKAQKLVKLLNTMCTAKGMNESELPKTVTMAEKLIAEYDDLQNWAQMFGLAEKSKKRKKA